MFVLGVVVLGVASWLVIYSRRLEVISKLGFWFHIKAAAKFKPEEYVGISMTWSERPTQRWGQKTFLRWLLFTDQELRPLPSSCFHDLPVRRSFSEDGSFSGLNRLPRRSSQERRRVLFRLNLACYSFPYLGNATKISCRLHVILKNKRTIFCWSSRLSQGKLVQLVNNVPLLWFSSLKKIRIDIYRVEGISSMARLGIAFPPNKFYTRNQDGPLWFGNLFPGLHSGWAYYSWLSSADAEGCIACGI
jgi:hypothetical protein